MEHEIGYYWITLNGEPMPAAWIGGRWFLIGDHRPPSDDDVVVVIRRTDATDTIGMFVVSETEPEVQGPYVLYLVDKATGRVICQSEDVATCERARLTGTPFDQTRNIRISFAYGSETSW